MSGIRTYSKMIRTDCYLSLNHFDGKQNLEKFTDAREGSCCIIICLCSFNNGTPFSLPMIFCSESSANDQLNLSVTQKEIYSNIVAYERFRLIFEGHEGGKHIFTDQKNL